MEDLINIFLKDQCLKNLKGVKLFKLNGAGTNWDPLKMYKLPFNRFVKLYNNNFECHGLGIY